MSATIDIALPLSMYSRIPGGFLSKYGSVVVAAGLLRYAVTFREDLRLTLSAGELTAECSSAHILVDRDHQQNVGRGGVQQYSVARAGGGDDAAVTVQVRATGDAEGS